MDQSHYRKVFRDIVQGSSEVKLEGDTIYIKHLSSLDQVDIDDICASYLEKAVSRGIPLQKDLLADLKKDGTWTDQDDSNIKRQESFIQQLLRGKSQLVLKSQLDNQNKLIDQANEELDKMKLRKGELLGINAEDYAEKRSNDYYIIKSFFRDKECLSPMFPNEEAYNELYAEDVIKYVTIYNETFKAFDELNIQKMILEDFYYIYFPFSDDTVGFFGRPVVELTYNQLKLIVYTKIFKNIF